MCGGIIYVHGLTTKKYTALEMRKYLGQTLWELQMNATFIG